MGLIFTNASVCDLKKTIESNRKDAVAKVGVVSPCEVVIAPGTTGMDPS